MNQIDAKTLRAIMPNLSSKKAAEYVPFLNEAMEEFGITNEARAAAFLAQLAHESSELSRWTENLNYSAKRLGEVFPKYFRGVNVAEYAGKPSKIASRVYASRMGNGNEASGEGYKYRGRSPMQLTGKDNYKAAGKALGLDLVGNPDLAADVEVGFRIAGWFWKKNGLNGLADKLQFREITKRINGGYNGLADRQKFYDRALKVIPSDFDLDVPEIKALVADIPEDFDETPVEEVDASIEESKPEEKPVEKPAEQPVQQTANQQASVTITPSNAIGVPPVAPVSSGRVKRLYTTVLSAIAGVGITIGQAFGWVTTNFERFKTPIIIIGIIVGIYLIGQYVMDYKREQAAVELTKKQMDIAADRSKDNVILTPAVTGAANVQRLREETTPPSVTT